MTRNFLLLLLVLSPAAVVLFRPGVSSAREKTDRLTLRNGDSLKGEIKDLTAGSLTYKTDSAGTIYVDWAEILLLIFVFTVGHYLWRDQFVVQAESWYASQAASGHVLSPAGNWLAWISLPMAASPLI
jgi:hypothetical protein